MPCVPARGTCWGMDINVDVHDLLLHSVAHLRTATDLAAGEGRGDAAARLNDLADRIDPHRYAAPAAGATSMAESLRSAATALDQIPDHGGPEAADLIRDLVDDLSG